MDPQPIESFEGLQRKTAPSSNSRILGPPARQYSGAWIWLLQRVAAVVTLIILALHLHAPFSRRIQLALLAALLLHAAGGIRVLLIDAGVLSVRRQAAAFWVLIVLAAAAFAAVYLGVV